MIFVTIGTTEPFDRLLRALDELSGDLVVQCGDGDERPEGARCVEYLTYEELIAHIRAADYVVSHAGVGTILTALSVGKRPIVVPRRKLYGEAVDDHQVELARHLAGLELVTLVEEPEDLPRLVADAPSASPAEPGPADGSLTAEVQAYLTSVIRGADSGTEQNLGHEKQLARTGRR